MGCDLTFPGCKGEMWAERCKQGEPCIKKAESRAMRLAEGCLQAAEPGAASPSRPRSTSPAHALLLDFWPPELRE